MRIPLVLHIEIAEPADDEIDVLAAEVGGKLLNRDFTTDNPFERDRRKTFQPVDLWEYLLMFAVILFPVDVGVRRIQLDWEEWLKATANLPRLLFFWQLRQQQTGTDESLASLLAKRDEARQSFERNKPSAPDPRVFQSEKLPADGADQPSATAVAEAGPVDDPHATEDDSTTSRLLAAKRRALRRKK